MRKSHVKLIVFLIFSLIALFSSFTSDVSKTNQPVILPSPTVLTQQKTLGVTDKEQETMVNVRKVIDGDTIEIAGGKRIRYIGIDTPEIHHPKKPVECFGQEAAEFNRNLVEGKEVRLEKDVSETDRYGRLLRYVYIGDLLVNDYLVRQGYAHAVTFPPDVKYADRFRLAEQEARVNNRGLWSSCK